MAADEPIQGNLFVAGGEDGLRAVSKDGVMWSHIQTDREGVLADHIAFLKGLCLVVARFGGENLAFTTRDAVTWQRVKIEGTPYTRVALLYTAKDEFQLTEGEGDKATATHSSDGVQWRPEQPLFPGQKIFDRGGSMRRVAIGADGRLVVVGDYGSRLTRLPSDPQWSAVSKPLPKDTLIDIAYGNGVFVGGGMHGLCMRSVDGLTWTDRTVGEEGEHINAMIWDGKQFVGIGQGATYFSADGQSWRREPNENAPTLATHGGGAFVGSLWPGRVMRSTDGIHWTQVHQFDQHVLSLAYGQLG